MKPTACEGQAVTRRIETMRRVRRTDVPWSRLVPVIGVLALSGWLFGASRAPAETRPPSGDAPPTAVPLGPGDSVAAIQRLDAARAAAMPELSRGGSQRANHAARDLGDASIRTPPGAEFVGGASQLSAACEQCHRFPHGLSHPVGVTSAIAPPEFPLDAGRVTCLTCHDERAVRPHERRTGRAGGEIVGGDGERAQLEPRSATSFADGSVRVVDRDSSSNAAFLRGESVDALCAACHQSSGGRGRTAPHAAPRRATGMGHAARLPDPAVHGVHAMGLLRAHLAPSLTRRSGPGGSLERMGRLTSSALGVDGESASCLSCHDGTVASDVGGHSERRTDHSAARTTVIRAVEMEGSNSHPIGVVYRSSGGAHGIELKSAAALDPRIRLFDQRVGCGSCHSMYSGEAKYQVFSNERSALCLSCHRM